MSALTNDSPRYVHIPLTPQEMTAARREAEGVLGQAVPAAREREVEVYQEAGLPLPEDLV